MTTTFRTTTLDWHDINVGDELTPLEIPVTATVIVAGAIASRDFMPANESTPRTRKPSTASTGCTVGWPSRCWSARCASWFPRRGS